MKPNLSNYYSPTQPNGLNWPHASILTLRNHKLLFCPIGKNGCTSLKRLMISLSDVEHKDVLLANDVHRSLDHFRTGLKLKDLDLDCAQQIMGSDNYFKFAVVRDPFARLVSAYLEKFVINRFRKPNQHHTKSVFAAVQGTDQPDFKRGITFAEFIRYITAQAPARLDPHWKPQAAYLAGVHYDRIYRMDELETLCHDLAARVGDPVALEKKNVSEASKPKMVAGAAYLFANELKKPRQIDKRSFLDSELMCAIESYFADDYRLYVDGQPTKEPAVAPQVAAPPPRHTAPTPPARKVAPRTGGAGKASDRPSSAWREAGSVTQPLRSPLLPTDTLFFLHLPKCGGTTFNGLLHQMYRRDSELYQNPYRRRELLKISRKELRSYRLIRGHFQYPDVIDKLGFRPRTVTVLRDPVARFISHYKMRKNPRWSPQSAAQKVHQKKLQGLSFEQFLARPDLTAELANVQYRFLAGFDTKAGRPHCDFDQPCGRLLDKFEVVGLLERFDESLELFCHRFDLPLVQTYSNRNVNPDRDKNSQLSEEVLERVAELNQHDLRLYAAAQQRFEDLWQRVRGELDRHPDGLPMLEEPQAAIQLDMSRVPPGNNWWDSGEHRRYGCVRWTGPGRSANLWLPLTPGSKDVSLTVVSALGEDVLRSLKLFVEEAEVPLTFKRKLTRFPRVYTGTIPDHVIRAQRRTKVSLQVSRTGRIRRDASRDVGVCVSNLEISPAADCVTGNTDTELRSSDAA